MRNHSGTGVIERVAGRAVALGLVALALAGCSAGQAGNAGQQVPSPSSHQATPTPTPVPTLKPDLGADENLPYFDLTVKKVLAKDDSASGASIVAALADAGFDAVDIEVTPDRTAADLEADSIQFAVRFNGECLVGQRGPEGDGYHSMIAPLLGTGRCLLGPSAK